MSRISVGVRIRPDSSANSHSNKSYLAVRDGRTIEVTVGGNRNDFTLDSIFDATSTQEDIFRACAIPVIDNTLDGVNGCILAYGQTGAGKTYTMSGPTSDKYSERGLTFRTVSYLFDRARRLHQSPESLSFKLSVLEIYNEQLTDLLRSNTYSSLPFANTTNSTSSSSSSSANPGSSKVATSLYAALHSGGYMGAPLQGGPAPPKLTLIDTANGVTIPLLLLLPLPSEQEAYDILQDANMNRVISEHNLNSHSSRSHVIYTFYITKTSRSHSQAQNGETEGDEIGSEEVYQSKLHLVDLAGSERVEATGSVGLTLRQASYINKSLSFLEQVVLALTHAQAQVQANHTNLNSAPQASHIPYRQSKLTYLLKDSLGGNCNTYMITCINPTYSPSSCAATLSSLRFAARMRCVTNRPIRNTLVSGGVGGRDAGASAEIQRLQGQIDSLKRELAMRDLMSGKEVFSHSLTDVQRARVINQACQLAQSKPIENDPLKLSSSSSNLPSELLEVNSISHSLLLVGTLRAMLWEACNHDNDTVNQCIMKTMSHVAATNTSSTIFPISFPPAHPPSSSYYNTPLRHGHRDTAGREGGREGMEEGWKKDRRDKDEAELSLLRATHKYRDMNVVAPASYSSGANTNTENSIQPEISNGEYPYDESSNNYNQNQAFQNSMDNIDNVDQPETINTASLLFDNHMPSSVHVHVDADGNSNSNALPPFESFVLTPQGSSLHTSYLEAKEAAHASKERQKELVTMVNQQKNAIDALQMAAAASSREMGKDGGGGEHDNKKEGGTSDNGDDDVDEETDGTHANATSPNMAAPSHHPIHHELEAAKRDYRALFHELQLCRRQVSETNSLKKRALATLMQAYENWTME